MKFGRLLDRPETLLMFLFLFVRINLIINSVSFAGRPEIDVPASSLKEHLEIDFLLRHGIDPYLHGNYCQPAPLTAILMSKTKDYLPYLFLLLDLISALIVYLLCDSKNPSKLAISLFNPLITITSTSLNSGTVLRVFILAALYFANKQRPFQAGAFLALAVTFCLNSFYLLIPLCLITRKSVCLWFILFLTLLYSINSQFSSFYLSAHLLCPLLVDSGKPNLGVVWYLFLEVFEPVRAFHLFTFALLLVPQIPAVCLRLGRRDIRIAWFICTSLVLCIYNPYPNATSYALLIDAFFLMPSAFLSRLNTALLRFLFILYFPLLAVLSWTHWNHWMHLGTGNANFYFSAGIMLNASLIILMLHVLWEALLWQLERDNPEIDFKEMDGEVMNDR